MPSNAQNWTKINEIFRNITVKSEMCVKFHHRQVNNARVIRTFKRKVEKNSVPYVAVHGRWADK